VATAKSVWATEDILDVDRVRGEVEEEEFS